MIVDLWDDAEEIKYLGRRRQRLAREKNRDPNSPKLGMPHGDARDIFGVRGEFAVARALGLEPHITRATSEGDPDPHYDGIWRGWSYEAKDTKYRTGQMAYQKKVHYLTQDIWILAVQASPDDLWRMKIAGWIWVKEMSNLWSPCHFDASAMCIQQSDLRKFKDLIQVQPKHHKTFKQGRLF